MTTQQKIDPIEGSTLVEHEGDVYVGKYLGTLPPPEVGTRVHISMNGFGPGIVKGYFVEHGYLGCLVETLAPPYWWEVQQSKNGKLDSIGHFFGVDFGSVPARSGRLEYGLDRAVPDNVVAAWGARAIWGTNFDLLPDRQGSFGPLDAKTAVVEAVNTHLDEMRVGFREVVSTGLTSSSQQTVNLIRRKDSKLRAVANPNGSHGHLYIAAWLTN